MDYEEFKLAAHHLGSHLPLKVQQRSRRGRMTCTQLHQCLGLSEQAFQKQFHLAAGGLHPKEPGWQNPAVIGNQQVSGAQQSR